MNCFVTQVNQPSKALGEQVNLVAVPDEAYDRPVFRTIVDLPAGQELLIDYGPHYDRSLMRVASE